MSASSVDSLFVRARNSLEQEFANASGSMDGWVSVEEAKEMGSTIIGGPVVIWNPRDASVPGFIAIWEPADTSSFDNDSFLPFLPFRASCASYTFSILRSADEALKFRLAKFEERRGRPLFGEGKTAKILRNRFFMPPVKNIDNDLAQRRRIIVLLTIYYSFHFHHQAIYDFGKYKSILIYIV